MRTDEDNQSRDPQNTLPPRQPGGQRDTETRGRRLILGTPTRNIATPAAVHSRPEVNSEVHRGFTLGKKPRIDAPTSSSKPTVQPWIIMVAVGAMVLLVVALPLRPSAGSSAETLANERLLAQYAKYLETKGASDITARRKDVVARLQAVAWAKAIGDKAALESELTALLFLDNDKGSPLYQYSVNELKQLGPPKKRRGF
jgi:hypothetical protein